ncbi:MAG: PilZ domain-containing protein [Candidatus Firestonebacteria bacterium]|nr:PilZ domain-containing protein [Candidatus Firestonebacteria bacterium]
MLENRRANIRVRVNIPVELFDEQSKIPKFGRFVDLSAGGGWILTNNQYAAGEKIKLSFENEAEKFVEVSAKVVRSKQYADYFSLGIIFENPEPLVYERFDRLVRRLHSQKERDMNR